MKKQFLSLLFLVLVVAGVSAQQATKVATRQERLRADITYLASDKLEGRRTGQAGATAAANYIADRFATLKLKPAIAAPAGGKTKPFLQEFPYYSGVELGTNNLLKIKTGPMTATINLKSNWMPIGSSSNGSMPETDIVFAGYGIVSEEAKIDDYRGLDVKEKIVLVFDGTSDAGNPHSLLGRFNDVRVKAKVAFDKGAKGMLVVSSVEKFEDDPLTRLRFSQELGDTAVPAAVIARPVAALLLGDKSEEELKKDEQFIALRKDAGEIQLNLTGRPKATAEMKVELKKIPAPAFNVAAMLEGNDPQLKNEVVIIGAHYDHLGRGGETSLAMNSTEIHHGADDNASGTAALMELARQFAEARSNKRTLVFIAFSGEEEGLIGSQFYVKNPAFSLDKTVAMINMDMVGRLKDNKLTIGGVGTASEWKTLLEQKNINDAAVIPGTNSIKTDVPALNKFDLALSEDGFGFSDHSAFYGKQIPVLFFFTGSHNDYHKPSDTADKINYEGEDQIVGYVADIVRGIDQNLARPTYKKAQSSGMGGRMTFSVSLGTMPNYSESSDGMLIDGVRDNSPAAKAGIKAGDKIIMLAGKQVRNAMDYTQVLSQMKAGEEYEIVIMRGTEKLTLKVIPAPAARR